MEDNPDEEEMDGFELDDDRGRHWRMVFEDNYGGLNYTKVLIHARRWDVYADEKGNLVKGGYLVEVVGNENNKVIWEVVNNHVV